MEKISIDDLANEKLPPKIIAALGKVKMSPLDMIQWDKSRPPIEITITGSAIALHIQARIPLKKAVAILSGVISLSLLVLEFTTQYLPTILSFLKNR